MLVNILHSRIHTTLVYYRRSYTHVHLHVLVQVEVPLSTAKKLILLSADRYDTAFGLTQYVSDNF